MLTFRAASALQTPNSCCSPADIRIVCSLSPKLSHGALLARARELAETQARLDALSARLASYQGLPPSLLAAQMKADEARQQLARVKSKMTAELQNLA